MCGILYSALGKYETKPTLEGRTNCVKALKRVAKRCAEFPPRPNCGCLRQSSHGIF